MSIKKQIQSGKALILVLILIFVSAVFVFSNLPDANAAAGPNSEGLKSGQTINGPGFFAGNLVEVDGTVEGTTFAAGQEVRVNGIINGDLFVAGQTIYINGKSTAIIYSRSDLSHRGQSAGVFAAGQNVDINQSRCRRPGLFAAGAQSFPGGMCSAQVFRERFRYPDQRFRWSGRQSGS